MAWLIDRVSAFGWKRTGEDDDFEHKDNLNFGNAFYFGVLTFLGKDTPQSPRAWSSRAAFMGMMFFFFFIWSVYDANLNAISVSSALDSGIQASGWRGRIGGIIQGQMVSITRPKFLASAAESCRSSVEAGADHVVALHLAMFALLPPHRVGTLHSAMLTPFPRCRYLLVLSKMATCSRLSCLTRVFQLRCVFYCV